MAGRNRKNNSINIVFAVFALVGIAIIIGGIYCIINARQFKKNAVKVKATIVNIETDSHRKNNGGTRTDHTTYVSYEYEGGQYDNVRLGYWTSSMYIGKNITILVDPDKPYKIKSKDGGMMAGILMLVMGTIFALVGIIPLILSVRSKKKTKTLIEKGRRIMAVVDSIDVNTSYRVNGRHPYVIYCTYTDTSTGMKYKYKSNNLWTDPTEIYTPGMDIPVYVDRNNYSKYFVDAETLINNRIVDYT